MPVTGGNSRLQADFFQTISSGVLTPYNVPAPISQVLSYSNGTGAGQYNQLHCKKYSLAATPQSIDLTSILLVDGTTGNMARVRESFFLMLSQTSAHKAIIDTTVSNGFKGLGDGSTGSKRSLLGVPANIITFNYDHWSDWYSVGAGVGGVTSSTSKIVSLDPGANSFDVLAIILGCSAVS